MWRRILLAALALVGLLAVYLVYVVAGLPARAEIRELRRRNPSETSLMHQREEEAKKDHRSLRKRQTFVPLSRISRNVLVAVVLAEDPKFFGHEGFDWQAIRESLETDLRKGGFFRGGSTITQQLAKNLFFTSKKSITRKLREVVVTRWLEADLPKKRILELYLNVIEWGDGVYGCEAGAEREFGKSAADLDPGEAAALAAMIPSPRHINARSNPARFRKAQEHILWLMAHGGYVPGSLAGLGAVPPSPAEAPLEDASTPEDEPSR